MNGNKRERRSVVAPARGLNELASSLVKLQNNTITIQLPSGTNSCKTNFAPLRGLILRASLASRLSRFCHGTSRVRGIAYRYHNIIRLYPWVRSTRVQYGTVSVSRRCRDRRVGALVLGAVGSAGVGQESEVEEQGGLIAWTCRAPSPFSPL